MMISDWNASANFKQIVVLIAWLPNNICENKIVFVSFKNDTKNDLFTGIASFPVQSDQLFTVVLLGSHQSTHTCQDEKWCATTAKYEP